MTEWNASDTIATPMDANGYVPRTDVLARVGDRLLGEPVERGTDRRGQGIEVATVSSGCVRRHSSSGANPATTTTESTRNSRPGLNAPSSTATGTNTATSTQSHQTRPGRSGGEGSCHTERTRPCTA